jgi:hypothetical protein
MVVGNGLLASGFSDFNLDKYIIFASGVSDSSEYRQSEFDREIKLLQYYIENFNERTFVYFNSILTKSNINTPYYNHKRRIVNILMKYNDYKIYNIPQVYGIKGNKNNIINYFIYCVLNNKEVFIQKNTYRSIIDIFDIKRIVLNTLSCDIKEFNISYIEKLEVIDIFKIVSELYKNTVDVSYINKGFSTDIKNDILVDKVINDLGIKKEGYTRNIINKYNKNNMI